MTLTPEAVMLLIETTPLEPGAESVKVYCPHIGLVIDNTVRFVQITTVP